MSISKRLFNFARSELNSLLDRAAELNDDDAETRRDGVVEDEVPHPAQDSTSNSRPASAGWGRRKVRLEDLSDEDLEAEIERRRLDRELDDRAEQAARAAESSRSAHDPRTDSTPRAGSPNDTVARAYAALEVPMGSDFEAVRKAYRTLMRKYHPDRHTATPEKQKAANELAQKLTDAYKTLERRLRPPTTP